MNSAEGRVYILPENFLIGTNNAAFQNEGNADGSRRTNFDSFLTQHPEKVQPNEQSPHWWLPGMFEQDIQTMHDLGSTSIGISLERARIEPEEGHYNAAALNRYHEMVDFITQLGMTPKITFDHFTQADWFAEKGGWENKDLGKSFADFSLNMAHEFGDNPYYVTINEPGTLAQAAYFSDTFPPAKASARSFLTAGRNMIAASNMAYEKIKKDLPQAQVGLSHAFLWYKPENPDSFFNRANTAATNFTTNTAFVRFTNNYADFIGCNYYSSFDLKFSPTNLGVTMRKDAPTIPQTLPLGETSNPSDVRGDNGLPIMPERLVEVLRYIHETYQKPIFVLENGVADADDTKRAGYILTHLASVGKAIREGIPIIGYQHWTTIDNNEWGDNQRFGLIELKEKGERKLRESSLVFSAIAESGEVDTDKLLERHIPQDQQDFVQSKLSAIAAT